jgi:hypothetical protein
MAVTGVNNNTFYANYYTETRRKNTTSQQPAGKTYRSVSEYKDYLTKKYDCLKSTEYSVEINNALLSSALRDKKTSEWLEYNLSLIPENVEKTKAEQAARGCKVLSCSIKINGYDSMTAETCVTEEVDPGTEKAREKLKEKKENAKKAQQDSVAISDEAVRQQYENSALDKKQEALMQHFMQQFANPKSLERYRVDDPFKMELRASSVFGEKNLFQDCSECQYKVFDQWMRENADTLSEEARAKIQEGVNNAVMAMDQLNVQSGYRGTSFASVALLESSRFALENVKNTLVPENLRPAFGQLIEEYVRFNEESRNNIMEKMTPAYIVEDIGKSTQHLTHKEELLASQQTFYEREKEEVRELLRAYYSDTSDKAKVTAKLQQYTERYYNNYHSMYSDSSLFDKGLASLMVQG